MADCYVAARRILGYRFNSEAELRRKLRAKRFDDATIAETIERLREEKWLDDERFAAAYVRTRVLKGIGRLRIRRELMGLGVDEDVVGRAVRENAAEGEDERLRAAYEKLARRLSDPEKIAARLLRQGFDRGAIRLLVWSAAAMPPL